jgi:hypothetical protein
MNEVLRKLPYEPRIQFLPYHERANRWTCIVAHRRAGKTVGVVNDTVTRALYTRKKDARYAYIAPYYGQAKMIAWDYLKKGTEGIQSKVLESELSVSLMNGSLIRLFGADNIDALRGIYLDGVILDEFADMNPAIWGTVIRPLLSDRRGWATFIGTPKGHNAFYDVREQARNDPDWLYLELKASETGIIPADELEDARKSMTEDQYNQEYECDFEAAIVGAYYGAEMKKASVEGRIGAVPWEESFKVNTYWDIGRNDNTVIWFAQEVAKEIRVLDVYAANGKDVDHFVEVLRSKDYDYDTHFLPHDAKAKTLATKRSVIEQLAYDHQLKCEIVPRLDLQDGIQATRKLLKRCNFDAEKCYIGIEALKVYQKKYDEENKRYLDKPLHNWASDFADAFRQLALSIEPATLTAPKRESSIITLPPPAYTLDALWQDHEQHMRQFVGRIR